MNLFDYSLSLLHLSMAFEKILSLTSVYHCYIMITEVIIYANRKAPVLYYG